MKKLLYLFLTIVFICQYTIAQVPTYVPTDGLVAYYPFNGNANDESGNGNNGTNNGAALTNDRFGNSNTAFYFSSAGCETRIDATINTSSITTGLTISVWILRVGNGCIGPRVLDFNNTSGNPGRMTIGWDNSGFGNIGSYTSNGTDVYSAWTKPSDNIWTHLVYTNDSSFGRFYQDGILFNTVSSTGNPILLGNAAFGRMNQPAYDAFNGKLDDIGIWNRPLTQEEITTLYESEVLSTNTANYENNINIYPNPANDHITIDFGNLDNVEGWNIKIINILGQEVLSQPMNTDKINVSELSKGVYIIRVSDGVNQTDKKFIKN